MEALYGDRRTDASILDNYEFPPILHSKGENCTICVKHEKINQTYGTTKH